MLGSFNNLFGQKAPPKGGPLIPETPNPSPLQRRTGMENRQVYSKVFRWRLPDGQTQEPATVEIVGTFSHWKKIPLQRDGVLDAWHATVHHIPGNKTHHYMLLVDGKPAHDKNCDGLAIPHGPEEESYALLTDRGPRLFMLFAQTK